MATVATNFVAPGGFAYIDLVSPATDGQFTTQPVVNDQILYPVTTVYVDEDLDISGADGAYTLYHIKAADGFIVNESYTISGNPYSLTVATNYVAAATQTQVELISGFDTYLFDGWTVNTPAIGWQFVTTTTDGYFDNLGNFYTDLEQVTDFWVIDLTGTAYYQTIDSTGLTEVLNLSPIDLGADVTNADPSQVIDRTFIISGIGASTVTVASVGDSTVNKNGGAFSGSVSAVNNDVIILRSNASSNFSEATITGVQVNSVTQDTINITTRASITPVISTQPINVETSEGSTILLSSVWDSTDYTFQWYLVGTGAITGANDQSYEINAQLADNGNQYYVTATSSDSITVQSNTVTLTVLATATSPLPQILGVRNLSASDGSEVSQVYTINNATGVVPTLGGADAGLFTLTNTGANQYTLGLTAKSVDTPEDADADNVYEVTINVDDGENPTVTATISITYLNAVVVNAVIRDRSLNLRANLSGITWYLYDSDDRGALGALLGTGSGVTGSFGGFTASVNDAVSTSDWLTLILELSNDEMSIHRVQKS